MPTLTLLDVVQDILSSLDGEEVNSIGDTTESMQVARLVRSTFYDLASDLDLPQHESLFELDPSLNPATPCLMRIPDKVKKIDWIKYNCKADADTNSKYEDVRLISLEKFIEMSRSFRNSSQAAQQDVSNNSETFEFMYKTDRDPTCYTVLDDYYMIFDSIDLTKDTTLQKSKTMCKGTILPIFSLTDGHIIDLNTQQTSLLFNSVKSKAFSELNQVENMDAKREARRQRIINQYQKRKGEQTPEIYRVPRYGRK